MQANDLTDLRDAAIIRGKMFGDIRAFFYAALGHYWRSSDTRDLFLVLAKLFTVSSS